MKRIVLSTCIALFAITGFVAPVKAEAPIPEPTVTFSGVTSPVDGIEIPIEILMDLQMEFQGQAVTQAKKMTINNIELYRLRVDRDSITTDHDEDTKYIHYDMEWKRIDDNLLKVVYPPKHDEEPALVVEEAPTVGVEAPKPADNKPRESKPAEQPKPSKPDPTSPSEEEPSEEQEPAPSTEPTTE